MATARTAAIGLVLLAAWVAMADISFSVRPQPTGVLLGQDLILDCAASETSGHPLDFRWEFDGLPTPLPLLPNNSLYVARVSRTELGEYTCVVSVTGQPTMATRSPPASVIKACIEDFTSEPASVTVDNGTLATLECVTGYSSPPAIVSWERDGALFTQGDQDAGLFGSPGEGGAQRTSMKLQLVSTPELEGAFGCVAHNPLTAETIHSRLANLTVLMPPAAPTLTTQPPQHPVGAASQPLTLACVVTGFPEPEVRWHVETDNGTALIANSPRVQVWGNGSLHFDVLEEEDAGMYKCSGANIHGVTVSHLVQLTVAVLDVAFVVSPSDVSVMGGQPVTLHCVPPRAVPSARVIWYRGATVLVEREGEFAVRVSDDGSLHFTSVQLADEGRYFCVAVNDMAVPSMRNSQPVTVTVNAAPLITEPPVPQRVLKGHLLTLTCAVQGRPEPTVRWYKAGELLVPSDRTSFQVDNLLIQSTIKDDQGLYRCRASNRFGNSSSASVLVFIVVPPQIVEPPQDATMRAGMQLLVPCRVYGDPPPTVTWTKGGASLVEDGRVTIGRAGVTLRAVRAQDEGTYSCHAVNEGGAIVASGTLRIEVKPSLLTYPGDVQVREGQSVALYCHGKGYPAPRYVWLYNGTETLPPGFQVQEGGRQLQTGAAGRQVSGQYTCVARNVAGQAVHTANLLVTVTPQISTIHGDLVIDQGSDLHLTCEVTGSPPPEVTWSFNREEIRATPDSRVSFPEPQGVLIRFARRENSGRYQCVAENDAGTDKTNVKVYVRETPFPPTLTSVHAVSMTSVNMTWEAATQNPDNKLTAWVVEYKERVSLVFLTYRDDIPPALRSHEVGGLRPFTEYLFRIAARNPVGIGSYSATLGVRTLESAPSAPRNVQMLAQNATAMALQWELPAKPNGIIRAYQVHYRRKYNVSEFHVVQIDRPAKTLQRYHLADLDPYTTYELKVRAATIEQGRYLWGAFSKPTILTTPAAPPSAAPPGVLVRVLTSRSIRVTWQPLPAIAHRGVLAAYIVQYRRPDANVPYTDLRVTVSHTSADVTGLLPWRHYNIRVMAVNQKGKGVFSDVTTVRTNPEVPTGRPAVVQVAPLSASAIAVRWQPIAPEQRNSEISGYVVEYENARIPGSDTFSRDIGHAAADALNITGLLAYTEYRVRVRGFTTQLSHGFGPSSPSVLVTTLEGLSGPVRNLMVTVSPTSVSLTWEPPETPSGVIRNYVVIYYVTSPPGGKTGNDVAVPRRQRRTAGVRVSDGAWELVTEDTNVTVTGLLPETSYSFLVAAETGGGRTEVTQAGPPKTVVLPPASSTPPPTSRPPVATSRDVTTTAAAVTMGTEPATLAPPGDAGRNYLPLILGASIGGAAVVLALLVLCVFCWCRHSRRSKAVYFIPPAAFAQQTFADGQAGSWMPDSSANVSARSDDTAGNGDNGETLAPLSRPRPARTTSAGTQSSIAIREGRPGHSVNTASSGALSRPLSEALTLSSNLDSVFDVTYTSLDDLRLSRLTDARSRVPAGLYLAPPQTGLENPAYDPGSMQDLNSVLSPHTDSSFLRASTVYTSQQDLYAQVNVNKRRKNRMKSETAAAIAAQKTSTTSLFLDTDALIKNDSVVVYDERTAL